MAKEIMRSQVSKKENLLVLTIGMIILNILLLCLLFYKNKTI